MRKIKYLLALAALLLCVPVLAAETPRLKIEVPGQNVKPQEEFAVTLSLHDIRSIAALGFHISYCLLCTSPSPRDTRRSRMPSSA